MFETKTRVLAVSLASCSDRVGIVDSLPIDFFLSGFSANRNRQSIVAIITHTKYTHTQGLDSRQHDTVRPNYVHLQLAISQWINSIGSHYWLQSNIYFTDCHNLSFFRHLIISVCGVACVCAVISNYYPFQLSHLCFLVFNSKSPRSMEEDKPLYCTFMGASVMDLIS